MGKEPFGKWLRKRRSHLGLTQGAIADALGFHRQAVSRWEQGNTLPQLLPPETQALCRVLRIPLRDLVEGCEFEKKDS